MTQPENQAANAARVGLAYSKDEAGVYWIVVTYQALNQSFSVGLPLDTAEQVWDQMGASLRDAVAAAKRERSGLVIAGQVPNHGPVNPRRPRRR